MASAQLSKWDPDRTVESGRLDLDVQVPAFVLSDGTPLYAGDRHAMVELVVGAGPSVEAVTSARGVTSTFLDCGPGQLIVPAHIFFSGSPPPPPSSTGNPFTVHLTGVQAQVGWRANVTCDGCGRARRNATLTQATPFPNGWERRIMRKDDGYVELFYCSSCRHSGAAAVGRRLTTVKCVGCGMTANCRVTGVSSGLPPGWVVHVPDEVLLRSATPVAVPGGLEAMCPRCQKGADQ